MLYCEILDQVIFFFIPLLHTHSTSLSLPLLSSALPSTSLASFFISLLSSLSSFPSPPHSMEILGSSSLKITSLAIPVTGSVTIRLHVVVGVGTPSTSQHRVITEGGGVGSMTGRYILPARAVQISGPVTCSILAGPEKNGVGGFNSLPSSLPSPPRVCQKCIIHTAQRFIQGGKDLGYHFKSFSPLKEPSEPKWNFTSNARIPQSSGQLFFLLSA